MISDFFERLFGSREPVSRDTAKQRLRFVLAHDRSDISPQNLEKLRQEILEVVSRYVELDFDKLEFSLESDQRITALMANLPIRRVRTNPLEPDSPVEESEDAPKLELEDGAVELDEVVEEASETADIPLD
ncbi:MAG: cell division topological specificity factor MinE [Leptolyngbyaceae cyanobacterium]